MSGDRLIPDLANEPPPDRDDDRPDDRERPRPERPPRPWDRPPEASQPPPPPPPPPPTAELPPPPPPQPFRQQQPPQQYPYVHAEEPRAEREPATPYASRFQLILGALLGIAAVAIVAAVLVGTGPKSKPDTSWSGWAPSSKDRGDAAQEIANHVAPTYRLAGNGAQLVAVTGGDLQVADLPVRLALADPANGNVSVLNGKGVLYTMCGLGPKCSINSGKPSTERHLLLRREALELALYTFRYEKGTDYVVALLPPPKGDDPTQAMFFTRGDLGPQLHQPLTRTLPAPPPTTETLQPTDVTTLESLTRRSLFAFKFEQGQDATVFLVLSPQPG